MIKSLLEALNYMTVQIFPINALFQECTLKCGLMFIMDIGAITNKKLRGGHLLKLQQKNNIKFFIYFAQVKCQ